MGEILEVSDTGLPDYSPVQSEVRERLSEKMDEFLQGNVVFNRRQSQKDLCYDVFDVVFRASPWSYSSWTSNSCGLATYHAFVIHVFEYTPCAPNIFTIIATTYSEPFQVVCSRRNVGQCDTATDLQAIADLLCAVSSKSQSPHASPVMIRSASHAACGTTSTRIAVMEARAFRAADDVATGPPPTTVTPVVLFETVLAEQLLRKRRTVYCESLGEMCSADPGKRRRSGSEGMQLFAQTVDCDSKTKDRAETQSQNESAIPSLVKITPCPSPDCAGQSLDVADRQRLCFEPIRQAPNQPIRTSACGQTTATRDTSYNSAAAAAILLQLGSGRRHCLPKMRAREGLHSLIRH